jgi:hypothetical protein
MGKSDKKRKGVGRISEKFASGEDESGENPGLWGNAVGEGETSRGSMPREGSDPL